MNQTVRTILTILAVAVAGVAAAGIQGMPQWAEVVLAALAAGFAAAGIVPPTMRYDGTRRYVNPHGEQYAKKGTPR